MLDCYIFLTFRKLRFMYLLDLGFRKKMHERFVNSRLLAIHPEEMTPRLGENFQPFWTRRGFQNAWCKLLWSNIYHVIWSESPTLEHKIWLYNCLLFSCICRGEIVSPLDSVRPSSNYLCRKSCHCSFFQQPSISKNVAAVGVKKRVP